MSRALDQVGTTFGRLTVLERAENDRHKNSMWVCQCTCGVVKTIRGSHLTGGNTRSCGCLDREVVARNAIKHGMRYTRIYNIWRKMKERCLNPNADNYRYYGARGVKVCDEWMSFEGFYEWVKTSGYRDDLTIDRINVFDNYCPGNCRWATMREQNNNTTRNHTITIGKETRTIQGWADEMGINRSTILSRLQNGWSPEDAVLMPRYQTRAYAKRDDYMEGVA